MEENQVPLFMGSNIISGRYKLFVLLWFHEDTGTPLTSHKMSKISSISQMTSDPKNKGALFSSTFKVEDNKVTLFLGPDIIWGRS